MITTDHRRHHDYGGWRQTSKPCLLASVIGVERTVQSRFRCRTAAELSALFKYAAAVKIWNESRQMAVNTGRRRQSSGQSKHARRNKVTGCRCQFIAELHQLNAGEITDSCLWHGLVVRNVIMLSARRSQKAFVWRFTSHRYQNMKRQDRYASDVVKTTSPPFVKMPRIKHTIVYPSLLK